MSAADGDRSFPQELVRRYVTCGQGRVRRYLKLLHGNFTRLDDPDRARFLHALAADARQITDEDLHALLAADSRPG
ncbi:hypothetical protein GCM10010406_35020 [Streptomyces thermolineatus]|uniref:Uncharacterized protein n=1 Tax=Streptomyces thermolineatus TaxID=44033 RepID=A0ABN3M6I4_9ACTN